MKRVVKGFEGGALMVTIERSDRVRVEVCSTPVRGSAVELLPVQARALAAALVELARIAEAR